MRDTRQPLRSGDLKHVVTIVGPAGTRAVAETEVEADVPTGIWAVAPQFQARESLATGGLQTTTQYLVSFRYRTDLLPSDVLEEACCTARRFQIQSIVPSERLDAVDLMCVTNG